LLEGGNFGVVLHIYENWVKVRNISKIEAVKIKISLLFR
jgi:hypothetical protein